MAMNLQTLADLRSEILLAEVAMWLHMLGKYQASFQSRKNNSANMRVPPDIKESFPELHRIITDKVFLSEALSRIELDGERLGTKDLSIEQVIKMHSKRKELLKEKNGDLRFLKLVFDSHGRGSGSEKGVFEKGSLSEQEGTVWLSSAVGHEEPAPIDLEQIDQHAYDLWAFLETQLNYLEGGLLNSFWGVKEWLAWRTPFIQRLKNDFSIALGDTQRPINDTTLWDQTAASVAFFKAELADVILAGWREPGSFQTKDVFQLSYKTLVIHTDGYSFLSGSNKIADILDRVAILNSSWDSIRDLLEVEYPISLEVYRDINRVAFLLPAMKGSVAEGRSVLGLSADVPGKDLEQIIQERLDSVAEGELDFTITLSDKPTRNAHQLGRQIEATKSIPTPTAAMLQRAWQQTDPKCSLCNVRPIGYGSAQIAQYSHNTQYYREKAAARSLCCYCMKRLENRSKKWCTSEQETTIWLDEIADSNGHIALLAANFQLDRWTGGQLLSTFSALNFHKIHENAGRDFAFDTVAKELANPNKNLKDINLYQQVWKTHAGNVSKLADIFVNHEDLSEDCYSSIPAKEKLALALWRKTPSFARIQRVWETTKQFWQETVAGKHGYEELAGESKQRLLLKADISAELGDYHAYSIRLSRYGVGFPFVWDPINEHFISAFNLDYQAKLICELQDKKRPTHESSVAIVSAYLQSADELLVIGERDSDNRTFLVTTLHNPKVEVMPVHYTRAIPIIAEPHQFMALVPADRALTAAKYIRQEYEVQFTKVKNRLPLHINLVFFPRRQPLYAVMDAARRMLERSSSFKDTWEVFESRPASAAELDECGASRLGPHVHLLSLKQQSNTEGKSQGQELRTLISYSTSNPEVQDQWYPYFFVAKANEREKTLKERPLKFKAPPLDGDGKEMTDLVHVKELVKGDQVYYTPSTFDFEFLDVTARRFELFYDEQGKRYPRPHESYSTRPYLLEELSDIKAIWAIIEKNLTQSQVKQMLETIEDRRQLWQIDTWSNETLTEFSGQVLRRVFGDSWKSLAKDQQGKLQNWAASGRLKDVLELYMAILKKDLK